MRFGLNMLVLLALAASPAFGQDPPPRNASNEYSLNLMVVGSKRYEFEGGAAARNDGGAGIGLTLARNLSNHFAVAAEASVSQFDYRASVVPGTGNAGARFDTEGTMEMFALRLYATWYLLSGPVAPFLTGGAGVNFLDPEFDANPPADACWVYPWYGQVCGARAPQTTLARLGYSAAAGVRFELPRNQGFVRVLAGGEWIDLSEASGTVGYFQLRADFGVRF